MEEVEDEMIDYFCFVSIDTDVIANGWLLRCVSLSNFLMGVFKFDSPHDLRPLRSARNT